MCPHTHTMTACMHAHVRSGSPTHVPYLTQVVLADNALEMRSGALEILFALNPFYKLCAISLVHHNHGLLHIPCLLRVIWACEGLVARVRVVVACVVVDKRQVPLHCPWPRLLQRVRHLCVLGNIVQWRWRPHRQVTLLHRHLYVYNNFCCQMLQWTVWNSLPGGIAVTSPKLLDV